MPHRLDRADAGRQASVSGFANEHIVVGILMHKYSNVSLVDLPLSSYDIVLVRKKNELVQNPLHCAQVFRSKPHSSSGVNRTGIPG